MLLPESTHALFVGALLVVLFLSFVREWVKPDVAVLTAVALLLVTGLLTPAKVLGVFSNSAPFTIACLFIISGALSRTGCVDWLGERIAQAAGRSEGRLLVGLLLVGLLVSPFINNTPVVMVMIPVVISLATRLSLSPSRLLIPLSYATILGGTVTLVGTSTNILVDGVARSMGLAPFSMFEITAPALVSVTDDVGPVTGALSGVGSVGSGVTGSAGAAGSSGTGGTYAGGSGRSPVGRT